MLLEGLDPYQAEPDSDEALREAVGEAVASGVPVIWPQELPSPPPIGGQQRRVVSPAGVVSVLVLSGALLCAMLFALVVLAG